MNASPLKVNRFTAGKKRASMDSLNFFEIPDISNTYSIEEDSENSRRVECTTYCRSEGVNMLENIFHQKFSFLANKCIDIISEEHKMVAWEKPINYKQKVMLPLSPLYHLNETEGLLSNDKSISSSFQNDKKFKYSHVLSRQMMLRKKIPNNNGTGWSKTRNQLKKNTVFPKRDSSKIHQNFAVSKETGKTQLMIPNNNSPLCTLIENFVVQRQNILNKLLENTIKINSELFVDGDALVPDVTSFLLHNRELHLHLDTHINIYDKSERTITENDQSFALCKKVVNIAHSSIFNHSDFNSDLTIPEKKLLFNFAASLCKIKEYIPERFGSDDSKSEICKCEDRLVPVCDVSPIDPDLLKLWKMLKRLRYQLGTASLSQLLSGILSLTEDAVLENEQIQSIINLFLHAIDSFCTKERTVLKNSNCHKEYLDSSSQTTLNDDASFYNCQNKRTNRKTSSQETLDDADAFNIDEKGRSDVKTNQDKEAGELSADNISLVNENLELQNVASDGNNNMETIEDQIVPNFQTPISHMEPHDRKPEFSWKAISDSTQIETANKNFSSRPIRLGLSRRQRTTPLHPYLATSSLAKGQ